MNVISVPLVPDVKASKEPQNYDNKKMHFPSWVTSTKYIAIL